MVTDTLPAALRVTAVRSSVGTCTHTPTTFRCELGTLRARASAEIELEVVSAAGTATQTVRNDAVVSTSDIDTDPSNDRASVPVDIVGSVPPTEGRLEVEKRAFPVRVRPGSPVRYRVVVRNRGSAPVRDVLVVDTNAHGGIVRGLTTSDRCSAATGPVVCRFDELKPGESVTIRYRTTYGRPGTAVNTVTVLPALGPESERTARTTVRVLGGAALRIRKVANRQSVRVGDIVRFRIRVTSLGPEPARGVRVCDRLPRAFLLASAPGGRGHRVVCWTLRGLAPGTSRTFTIRAQAVVPRARVRNAVTAKARNTRTVRARRSVAILPRPQTVGLG